MIEEEPNVVDEHTWSLIHFNHSKADFYGALKLMVYGCVVWISIGVLVAAIEILKRY